MTGPDCAIIGAGPAGLFAAEAISAAGYKVHIYDRKPSAARKFLMAGRGGLNLTHSEDLSRFITRYGVAADWIGPIIRDFPPESLRRWCDDLGEASFIGSSGRVFPKSFKASPLLRAWLQRLETQGVAFHFNHDWVGFDSDGVALFQDAKGVRHRVVAQSYLLALGGASWPRLGSDGRWIGILKACGVAVRDLYPVNCGFAIDWSDVMRGFAGHPLKTVSLSCAGQTVRGDMMITQDGVEGGVVYALSSVLQDKIAQDGCAELVIDLRPDQTTAGVAKALSTPRGGRSLSAHLTRRLRLSPVARAVLFEAFGYKTLESLPAQDLAVRIKAVTLRTYRDSGLVRAISTAGGVTRDAVSESLMLKALPGVFIAGEMLDWDAPTGGYLLQGCFATGLRAGKGVCAWLEQGAGEGYTQATP